jgi:arginase family enzyme
VVFPFDLFGSGGCAAGAELIADELREIEADNQAETVETRACAYSRRLRMTETAFRTPADYSGWRERGQELARTVLKGDLGLWLTGNHLGALPLYDLIASTNEHVLILQLDAHLDIHHFHDCQSEPSHGNFLLHVDGTLPPVVNVGHRELLLPTEYIGRFFRPSYGVVEWVRNRSAVLEGVQREIEQASRVWIDLDCDVLDPSVFPAVPRPVPFGLMPLDVLAIVETIPAAKLAGLILSEFDPGRDQADRSLALLLWLIEHLFLRKYE